MEYTYEEQIKKTSDFLDKIDIQSYIKSHMRLYELCNKLEDEYNDKLPLDDNDFFEGCLFNYMNEDEFKDYLFKRYGYKLGFYDVTYVYAT